MSDNIEEFPTGQDLSIEDLFHSCGNKKDFWDDVLILGYSKDGELRHAQRNLTNAQAVHLLNLATLIFLDVIEGSTKSPLK